jgi:hypothetical protein
VDTPSTVFGRTVHAGENPPKGDRCHGCGEPWRADACFCRSCGARRSATENEPLPEGSRQAHHPGAPAGYPASIPSEYPTGTQDAYPGYPAQLQSDPTMSLPGHPVQQQQDLARRAAERPSTPVGWIIGGVAAATLAVAAIAVGIVLGVSGGSGGQARLVATPVVTGASSSALGQSPGGGRATSSRRSPSVSAARSAIPRVPISVSAAPRATIAHASQRNSVAGTIRRHFALISEHKFSAAYALLAPRLQTGESSWVASHRGNGIFKVTVVVDATVQSATSASARIVKMTTLDGEGCKNWSGSWGLTKIAGRWRISEANVTPAGC